MQLKQLPHLAVIKRFKVLLHFVDTEHYRGAESVLKGIEMALNRIVVMLYMFDILYCTVFNFN